MPYAVDSHSKESFAGAVTLTAGGAIFSYSIDAHSENSTAGAVTLTANDDIATTSVYSYSENADAGSVTITAGDFITAGTIRSWGTSSGGYVEVVAMGTLTFSGDIQTFSTGQDGRSGSVALVAAGHIGAQGVSTFAGGPSSMAGNVFLSSGSETLSVNVIDTSADSGGTAGRIFLGAAGSYSHDPPPNGPSSSSSSYISFSLVSSQVVGTPIPFLFYKHSSYSITSDAALIVSPGSVNILPGIYLDIGSSTLPVRLTLDLGGDSRTIVPVLGRRGIYLSGFTANNPGGGVTDGGYAVSLVSGSEGGISLNGDVTSRPAGIGTPGGVSLFSLGLSPVNQLSGSISGNSLKIVATGGDIGSSGRDLLIDAHYLSFNTRGNVYISDSSAVALTGDSSAALLRLRVTATVDGSVTLGSASSITAAGDITITGSGCVLRGNGAIWTSKPDGVITLNTHELILTDNARLLAGMISGRVALSSADTLSVNGGGTAQMDAAGGIFFRSAAGTLSVNQGSLKTSGPLTIVATGTGATINILSSFNTGGDNLSLLSEGNIAAGADGLEINTTSLAGGGAVLMIAGETITGSGPSFTLGGPSSTGGSINFAGSHPVDGLTTEGIVPDTAGGAVRLIAIAGSGGGVVALPSGATIATGGRGRGSGGAVIVTAGSAIGTAITLGDVDASGGSGGADIQALCGNADVYGAVVDGAGLSAGPIKLPGNGAAVRAGDITVAALTAAGANITVLTGGDIGTGTLSAGGTFGPAGHITLRAGSGADGTSSPNNGTIDIRGPIIADGAGFAGGGGIVLWRITASCNGRSMRTSPPTESAAAGPVRLRLRILPG